MPTLTRFGTVWPGTTLRFDASGMPTPAGHTVTWLVAVGPTAVTLSTTADTPVAGTPPRPVTCRSIDEPPLTLPAAPVPVPSRVSRRRAGVTGWKPVRRASQAMTCTSSMFQIEAAASLSVPRRQRNRTFCPPKDDRSTRTAWKPHVNLVHAWRPASGLAKPEVTVPL